LARRGVDGLAEEDELVERHFSLSILTVTVLRSGDPQSIRDLLLGHLHLVPTVLQNTTNGKSYFLVSCHRLPQSWELVHYCIE